MIRALSRTDPSPATYEPCRVVHFFIFSEVTGRKKPLLPCWSICGPFLKFWSHNRTYNICKRCEITYRRVSDAINFGLLSFLQAEHTHKLFDKIFISIRALINKHPEFTLLLLVFSTALSVCVSLVFWLLVIYLLRFIPPTLFSPSSKRTVGPCQPSDCQKRNCSTDQPRAQRRKTTQLIASIKQTQTKLLVLAPHPLGE